MKNTTTTFIYPELGEKTTATIQYSCAHGGGYYFNTDLELKGRGIKMVGDGSTHLKGKKSYVVTEIAFKQLEKKYDTCYIGSL